MSKEQIDEMAKVIKSSLDGLGYGNFNFTGEEISEMFAEALYNAGYRKQSEWISVEERLPEEDTIVLVWYGEVSVYNYLHNDLWYTGYCDITTYDGGITHWMPLPEPPKMKGGVE